MKLKYRADGNGWGKVGFRICRVWWAKAVQGRKDSRRVEVDFFRTNAEWGGLHVYMIYVAAN